jgi:hypothetical protein
MTTCMTSAFERRRPVSPGVKMTVDSARGQDLDRRRTKRGHMDGNDSCRLTGDSCLPPHCYLPRLCSDCPILTPNLLSAHSVILIVKLFWRAI